MNFFKALFSWKLWLAIILGLGLLVGLWFLSFKYLGEYTQHGIEIEVPDLAELSIQEAMHLLDEKGLKYEVDSIKYTEDFPPYAILDFYPTAGSNVKPGRRIFIKSNPSTWQPVALPNLINKSKRLAYTQLEMRGFSVGDTIYVKDQAKDAVLAVLYKGDTIQKGKLLPKGAKIDLILGRGLNFDVPVPNIVGLTLAEAKQTIRSQYFELGQIYFLDEDSDTLESKVVYQDPPSKDIYDEGLPISVWLSTQPKEELRKITDSLDIVYRRVVEQDSIFYNSVKSSKDISIKDLPEEIRNQVKYDQDINRESTPKPAKPKVNRPKRATVDTTGISIE